jgi:hypothetical protein
MYDGVPDTNFQNGRNEGGDVSVFVNPMKPIHLLAGTAGIGLGNESILGVKQLILCI